MTPKGLGGYRIIALDLFAHLDKRQKYSVKCFYAELIERNKYAPRWNGSRK